MTKVILKENEIKSMIRQAICEELMISEEMMNKDLNKEVLKEWYNRLCGEPSMINEGWFDNDKNINKVRIAIGVIAMALGLTAAQVAQKLGVDINDTESDKAEQIMKNNPNSLQEPSEDGTTDKFTQIYNSQNN